MVTQGVSVRLGSPRANPPGEEDAAREDINVLAASAVLLARYTGVPRLTVSWHPLRGTAGAVNTDIQPATTWTSLVHTLERASSEVTADHAADADAWHLSMHVDALGISWLTLQGNARMDLEMAGVRGHLDALLDTSLRVPDLPISSAPTLTGPELADIERWNSTTRTWPPGPRRLDALFEARAALTPDHVAIAWPGGTMTYRQLDERSHAVAADLEDRGTGPGSLVGVSLPRGWRQIAAVIGVLRTGAAYVPIDPAWPTARRALILERCRCGFVVTDEDVGSPTEKTTAVSVPEARGRRSSASPDLSPEDLAYVIFTSGSTGEPKGVMIDHASAVNTILDINERHNVTERDRVLALSSLTFDLSVYDIFGTLAAGATIICLSERESDAPAHWLARTAEEGVTIWNSVPALLQGALDETAERTRALRSLRLILLSGDRIPVDLPARARLVAPGAEVFSLGGATEGSIWSIEHPAEDVPAGWSSIPYGRPLANQQFHVLDVHGQHLPVGMTGELWIGGRGVARGYHDEPELTAERFLDHPQLGRIYRTGDQGRRSADGVIEFLGRLDTQVKIRGFRIELGEVEAALRRLPGVRDAVAAVHQSPRGEPVLAAHVIPVRDTKANPHHVGHWTQVFDGAYSAAADGGSWEFAGWTSGITGRPIAVEDMRDWADRATQLVLEGKPRHVLEIGCGTGILVRRLAHHVSSYYASDPSAVALDLLEKSLDPAIRDKVTVAARAAHELGELASGCADTLILNSVVQYFPDVHYLIDVLAEAIRLTALGGRVVVGDVRHAGLLDDLYAEIELARSPRTPSSQQLRDAIKQRKAAESELAVDPQLFRELPRLSTRVTAVDIRLRDNDLPPELGRYRYDVVITLDTTTGSGNSANPSGQPWSRFTNRPVRGESDGLRIEQWRLRLQQALPHYLLPTRWIVEDEFPLTSNGKVDRKRLEPPPRADTASFHPQSPEQRVLAEAWRSALGIDDFGPDDNFLDLGGTSLSATIALNHLASRGAAITPQDFLQASSFTAQAKLVAFEQPPDAPPVRRRAILPFTPAQAGLLAESLADPLASTYVVHGRYRLTGLLDLDALRTAWEDLHSRHPLLGARIIWDDDGLPRFDLTHPVVAPWSTTDLRGLPHEHRERAADEFLRSWCEKPWDIDDDPLLQMAIVLVADEAATIAWRAHHVVLDGWSVGVLEQDLWRSYSAARHHAAVRPEPIRVQDRYLAWLEQQDHAAAAAFWSDELADVSPTALPLDGPADAEPGILRVEVPLDQVTLAGAEQLVRAERITVTTLLHGAWAILLARYTGRPEVILGATSAGRPPGISGIATAVGNYVTALPLRADVRREHVVREWLADLQARRLRCQRFEFAAPATTARAAADKRTPLFETAVITDNHPASRSSWAVEGVRVDRLSTRTRTQWQVTVFAETHDRLRLFLQCDAQRVSPVQANRLARHLAALLGDVTARPEARIGELAMLSDEDQHSLTGTVVDHREHFTDLLFAEWARRTPDATAVMAEDGELTYAALEQQAADLARRLHRRRIGRGSLVGVCLSRGTSLVSTLLAVLRCGAAYLPLDPSHPPQRLRLMLEDSCAETVLTDAGTRAHLAQAWSGPNLDVDDHSEPGGDAPTPHDRQPDDVAYVIYTSGSTGKPKAVEVTHHNLINALLSFRQKPGLTTTDRLLAVTTPAFDIAALELFLPLVTGATVVVAGSSAVRDSAALADHIDRSGITVMQATPTTWRMLVNDGWRGAPGLRCFSGGEALTRDLADALLTRTASVWNLYGPTETTIWSAVARVGPGCAPITLGDPISNTTLHTIGDDLEPVPPGVPGELCIGGDGVAVGYRRQAELTRRAFFRLPGTGERVYRTGDMVRIDDDGELRYLGRRDDQLKFRGTRIEPAEMEQTLRLHPGVADSVVILQDDRLIGHVVPSGARPGPRALRAFLQEHLPRVMVPAAFVWHESLPLTPNGKVDRRRLPPPPTAQPAEPEPEAHTSPVEHTLLAIWRRVLGTKAIGLEDNFFDLGGDSITALQIVIQARREGLDARQRQLFDHPTVAAFATAVAPSAPVPEPASEATGNTSSPFPLSGLTTAELAELLSALDRRKGKRHG